MLAGPGKTESKASDRELSLITHFFLDITPYPLYTYNSHLDLNL